MLSLIKFELKKMLTRRVAVAANAGAIVMLVAVMALNVMQARAEGNIGEILSGPEAIAHRREVASGPRGRAHARARGCRHRPLPGDRLREAQPRGARGYV